MKAIIAAIAALGAMSSFVGSAMADVSINLRFGSTPTYRNYDYYRSNVYRQVYPNNYDRYNRNVNSTVIVREAYPSSSYYGNYWNRRSTVYNPYNVDLGNRFINNPYNNSGNRFIVEQRIIRVR
ncbi:MAG: hypothetical protein DCF19_12140 [Pseudanabaena frigida]|uniref:Uncharacterized protein n=1 Tax=Pseudanabaena frigida TaxID=945775 RepID=A0A2W4W851_9CYAN|nr:MAG: hypothetical protein DCF19_12140 [Pseudanabaena frigida]